MIQIHAHEGIARLHHREEYRHVRLRAGVWLHVDVLTAEKLFRAVSGNIFHHVHTLAAAVISLAGISFRVLVRKRAAHSCHYRLTHPVFRSNQLNMGILPVLFVHNRLRDLRVNVSYLIQ